MIAFDFFNPEFNHCNQKNQANHSSDRSESQFRQKPANNARASNYFPLFASAFPMKPQQMPLRLLVVQLQDKGAFLAPVEGEENLDGVVHVAVVLEEEDLAVAGGQAE